MPTTSIAGGLFMLRRTNKKLDIFSCRVFYFPIHKEILYRICRGMVALQGVTDALKAAGFRADGDAIRQFHLINCQLFFVNKWVTFSWRFYDILQNVGQEKRIAIFRDLFYLVVY